MEINDKILIGPSPIYAPAAGGLGYEIFRSLKLNKGKVAQNITTSGKVDTYDDLLTRSIRTAIFLSKRNYQEGDVICMCSENDENCVLPLIAAKFVGLNYVSFEPGMPEEDLEYLIDHIEPKIIFVSEKALSKIEVCSLKVSAKSEIIVLGNAKHYTTLSQILVSSKEEGNFKPVFLEDLKETAFLLISSGTTGKPKPICISHYAVLAQVYIFFDHLHHKGTMNLSNFVVKYDDIETPKMMLFSPLYWATGVMLTLGIIFNGGTKVTGEVFNAEKTWEALEKYRPDSLYLPPGQTNALCFCGFNKKPIDAVDVFLTSGGLVTKTHLENIRKCLVRAKVVQAYGLSEIIGAAAIFDVSQSADLEFQQNHPESCGKASPGAQIKVVDIDTEKLCESGEHGEIRLKSEYLMNGYYKMDTSSAFDSDGWYRTGDLGYFDKTGHIYIVDRIKDTIHHTNYDIRPSDIEKVLIQHPAVFDGFVIGIPHPTDDEQPLGVVLLKEEYRGRITEQEIASFVDERVPSDRYKLLAGVKFVDKVFKTISGKIKKNVMKRLILAGDI